MNLGSIDSLAYFYPEGILILTILVIFVADLVVKDKEQLGYIALVGATLALVFTSGLSFFGHRFIAGLQGWGEGWLFHRMVVLDNRSEERRVGKECRAGRTTCCKTT